MLGFAVVGNNEAKGSLLHNATELVLELSWWENVLFPIFKINIQFGFENVLTSLRKNIRLMII